MRQDARNGIRQEDYMHDYDGVLTKQVIMGRRADTHAAFLLPHLRSGMSLLDCGCGPGTITAGLAEVASPGEVIGIDLEVGQLELARENATKQGLSNLSFESCSVYELPYQDARFDVVFSNAMLEHMQDPTAVLKEMYRVLEPGGLIGIRTIDLAATLIAPEDAALTTAHEIWLKYRQYCGGDPFIGRRLRALLRETGFRNTSGTATSETWGTPQLVQSFMPVLKAEFTGPKITEAAIQEGWADQAQMDRAVHAIESWGGHGDAFMAIVWCEAIGWKE